MPKKKTKKKKVLVSTTDSLEEPPTIANIKYWANKHLDKDDLLDIVITKMCGKEDHLILGWNNKIDLINIILKDIKKYILTEKHKQYCDFLDNLYGSKKVTGHTH